MQDKGTEFDLSKFLFGTLGRKIITSFMLIGILLMTIGAYSFYLNSNAILTKEIYTHLETVGAARARYIETILQEDKQLVEILAAGIPFTDVLDPDKDYSHRMEEAILRIERTMGVHPDISRIRVLDKNGIVILSSHEDAGLDRSTDEIFLKGKERSYVGNIHLCEYTKSLAISVATPIYLKGEVSGVLVVNFDVDEVYKIATLANRIGLKETGKSYLVNAQGDMISYSKLQETVILKNKANTVNMQRCFEHARGEEITHSKVDVFPDYRGVSVIGTHVYLPEIQWCLLVEIDEAEALGAPRNALIKAVLFFAFLLAFLISFSSFFLSKFISRPILQLHKATRRVEQGDFEARVDIKTGDEVEELADTFNKTVQALQNMDEEHKEIERAKTEFLSITSHELRSPMTSMRAQLQMLTQEYFGKLNEKQKDAADMVLRNTQRLDRIIVDLLDVSRIEAARLKFRFVKTDLAPHIDRLVKEMMRFMPKKKVKIVIEIEKLSVIEIDPDRVMQVLRNLVNNAIKFCSPPNCVVKISVRQEGDYILFCVRDKGVGMHPEDLKRVFEPFFQAERSIYKESGGTGLGLTICKGIIESQGGRIWAESKPGSGTAFYFTVPLKPVKKVRSIQLMFSSREKIDKRIGDLFKKMLGPLGETEFELLQEENRLIKDELLRYIDSLVRKGVLGWKEGKEFKRQVMFILSRSNIKGKVV